MAAFSAIVFLLHEMVTRPEGYKVCVIRRSRNGHAARTTHVSVAQLVGELLQFVCVKMIVIPENMIVTGSTGSLDALMATQVEVKLSGMSDSNIDCSSSWDIARLSTLFFFCQHRTTLCDVSSERL